MDSAAEYIDEHDYAILARLGYAVARAQLFEFAMLKLVEAQRHDPAELLDERWPEVEIWLKKWTAARSRTSSPSPRRSRPTSGTRSPAGTWGPTTRGGSTSALGPSAETARSRVQRLARRGGADRGTRHGGLITIMHVLKASTTPLTTTAVLAIWREHLPTPVDGVTVPAPEPDANADAAAAKFKNEP